MRFGLFYQHQLPRPWVEGAEVRNFANALEQAALAEKLGFDSVWVTEHHFLEEYSHSSAPEVFLGAVAARTNRIRLGHGIRHTPPLINPPARLAEALATLDVISNGRVEFGFGEGATRLELAAHSVPAKQKRAMSLEAAEQIIDMMVMSPYPGWDGEFFKMQCRNVVPKPVQRPHPPIWMACTNRETMKLAARLGVGALAFTFLDPYEAAQWVSCYYDIIKSEECVPIGHAVNARIAMVSGLSVASDRAQGIRNGYHCFNFFNFALKSTILNDARPGHTDLWSAYLREEHGDTGMERAVAHGMAAGSDYHGSSGTAEDVAKRIRIFRDAGVDDLLFTIQGGGRSHENICETLTAFSRDVMPEFSNEARERRTERVSTLAPYIAAALDRKKVRPPLSIDDIPIVPGAKSNLSPSLGDIKLG
jgi:alkanesulfonate monooxygenase SsuD/methylene tetrahydromethanopterin reductase-like flavin-dependent oxidoreductase (luciferase family)